MKNGLVLREDTGSKFWYKNNLLHRLNGPAVENFQGKNDWTYWYYNGIEYDKEDHPFNVFRKEYILSEIYNDWPNDMKVLFKLSYG